MLLLQVHTAQQDAICTVAAYPSIVNINLFEALGEQYGAPSVSDILSQPLLPQNTPAWDRVSAYVQTIDVHNMFDYVPFGLNCM